VPYRSEKQRGFMHAKHPEIVKRWDKEYGGKVAPKKAAPAKHAKAKGKK